MRIYLIILSTLLLLTGCRHTATDPAIRQAELLADSLPRQALSIIDSIPVASLSGHDRFLHNYLRIKTEDKLFITHRNDSLLRHVLDYAKSNRRSVDYPEVLYYAGRVYSDMGDYPTALENYYNALEEIPEDENIRLRAKILSNIGYIHTATCLYDKGIEAFTEAIKLDSICGDTINIMYDLISMSNLYFNKKNYDAAENITLKVLKLSTNSFPQISAESELALANIKLYKHEYDSARLLIKNNIENVDPIDRNKALSIAANIYYYAGYMDSAYIYANRLLHNPDLYNKSLAYTLLLSDGLRKRVPEDSISSYIRKHNELVVDILNKNSDKEILLQSTHHNYNKHLQSQLDAEHRATIILRYLIVSLIILFIISLILCWLKIMSNKQKIQLIEFQKDIANLNLRILQLQEPDKKQYSSSDVDSMGRSIIERIEAGEKFDVESFTLSEYIANSEPYKRIKELIKQNTPLSYDNTIWRELDLVVNHEYPDFLRKLETLMNRPLKESERIIVLLMKCNFTVTDISKIMGRQKGSTSYHRKIIGQAIFKKTVPPDYIDPVIKLL